MKATRVVVFAGAGVVGAAATATSAVSLYQLAQTCGIPGYFAAALPIALDVGAGVASLAWITETGAVRTWSRGIAVAALAGTVAGNGIQHAITQGLLSVTLPLVLTVGASIPAMLWAIIHLGALLVQPERKARRAAEPAAKSVGVKTPSPVTTPAPPPSDLAKRGKDRTAMEAWLHAQPPEPFAKEIAALLENFPCSESTAKRVRRQVRQQVAV